MSAVAYLFADIYGVKVDYCVFEMHPFIFIFWVHIYFQICVQIWLHLIKQSMQWYIFHLLTICLNKHQILLNCFLWLFVPEKFPSVLFIRNFSIRMFSIDVYLKTVAHFFQLIYTSEIIATCTVLKFCIKNIFSKCDKNCSFLQI